MAYVVGPNGMWEVEVRWWCGGGDSTRGINGVIMG